MRMRGIARFRMTANTWKFLRNPWQFLGVPWTDPRRYARRERKNPCTVAPPTAIIEEYSSAGPASARERVTAALQHSGSSIPASLARVSHLPEMVSLLMMLFSWRGMQIPFRLVLRRGSLARWSTAGAGGEEGIPSCGGDRPRRAVRACEWRSC